MTSLPPHLITADFSEVTAGNTTFKIKITDYPNSCVLLSAISCVLSIFGALGIFCTYGLLPEIRNVTRKLIICLTVADFLTACGYLISVYRYARIPVPGLDASEQLNDLCVVQSVITTYFTLASFFLTVFIGIHLAVTVVQRRVRTGTTVAFVVFNLISWIAPGIIVGVAIYERVFGEDENIVGGTGPWCWIDTRVHRPILWMVVTGKGWEITCFLLTVSIYVLIKYYQYLYYHRTDLHGIHESLRTDDHNVLYLWFILYALRMWGTVRFLIFALDPDVSKDRMYMQVLLYFQAFGDPAQGFFNFILFCLFDKTVKAHMRSWANLLRRRVTCDTRPEVEQTCVKEPLLEEMYGGGQDTARMPTYDSFMAHSGIQGNDGASERFNSSEMHALS